MTTTAPVADEPGQAGGDEPRRAGGAERAGARPGAGAPTRAGVPAGLAGATAWSWRLLVVVGAVVALLALLRFLALVTLPVAGALLLSALLHPVTAWLRRHGWTPLPATAATLLVAVAAVGGVLWFAVTRALAGYQALVSQAAAATTRATALLEKVPGASSLDLATVQQRVLTALRGHYLLVVDDAMAAATMATEAVTAVILTVFTTFFFLHQGERMFASTVRLLPRGVRPSIHGAGHRAWRTLTGWVGGTVVLALVHGVVIGSVLEIVGVPLALPLALLVVLASLLPVVGVFIGGLLSVGVTLLSVGPTAALVVLLAVVAEDQVEAHLLEPFIVGRAVRLHPVVMVLSLTAGAVVGGIFGALLAVPLVASVNAATLYLTGAEDVHGHRRGSVDRSAPMELAVYAPLPFLGLAPHVAAVRQEQDQEESGDPGPRPARSTEAVSDLPAGTQDMHCDAEHAHR